MKASWEDGEAYIAPSAKHPGFFFVAILLNVDGGGADVEGISKPIRSDGVALYIDMLSGSVIPDGIEWETFPADPWEHNLYLGPYDPLPWSRTAP
jgi:UDP-N-acetylglucosamine enolpyruvyl transferase